MFAATPQFERYDVYAPVRYRADGDNRWNAGETINISRSGVLFYCDELLPVGAQVQIYMAPHKNEPDPGPLPVCSGKVIRVVDYLADSRAAMAIQFM